MDVTFKHIYSLRSVDYKTFIIILSFSLSDERERDSYFTYFKSLIIHIGINNTLLIIEKE